MWYYENKEFTEEDINDNYGFVYRITNLTDGRMYIGKKFFWFMKTRQVNKKKKRFKELSDWQLYYGSNDALKADVLQFGEANFKREIIRLCKTKAECSYFEAKHQFLEDCILRENYYNGWISCKITRMHLKKLSGQYS